jgi:hypothetical protein
LASHFGSCGAHLSEATGFDHVCPRSAGGNSYAERPIGSIRRECLDHVVVVGESPPKLLRLLPAGAVAGWDLHPLESAALSRRWLVTQPVLIKCQLLCSELCTEPTDLNPDFLIVGGAKAHCWERQFVTAINEINHLVQIVEQEVRVRSRWAPEEEG